MKPRREPPVVRSRWFPWGNVEGITLLGVVFLRRDVAATPRLLNHERIHCRQQKEWLYLPFFVIYLLEWLWHLVRLRNWDSAYRAISFEREAYAHDHDPEYLKRRRPFATFR